MIPNSCAVLPEEWSRLSQRPYHQTSFPYDTRGVHPIAADLADMGGDIISLEAAKLGILYASAAAGDRSWAKIRALAACTRNPDHVLQARDFESAVQSLHTLDRIHVYTPAHMRMRLYQFNALPVLTARLDPNKRAIFSGVNSLIVDLQRSMGREYAGSFPVNLTGLLQLERPIDLRFYIRLAAATNAAHEWIDPTDHKKGTQFNRETFLSFARSTDRWARIVNAYSQSSLDFMAARDGGRHRRSPTQDRKRIDKSAEHLVALRLGSEIHVESPRGERRLIVLPTAAALEAQQMLLRTSSRVALEDLHHREPLPLSRRRTGRASAGEESRSARALTRTAQHSSSMQ